MSTISALSTVQAAFLGRAQAIAGGNTDPTTIIGLASDQNQFKADIKVFKAQDDMTKEVINLLSPNKVDIRV